MCVLALLVAGCQNSDDDNRGLEYDTLRVNFKGSMTNGAWETGAEVRHFRLLHTQRCTGYSDEHERQRQIYGGGSR